MWFVLLADALLTGSAIKLTRDLYRELRASQTTSPNWGKAPSNRIAEIVGNLSEQDRQTLYRMLKAAMAPESDSQVDSVGRRSITAPVEETSTVEQTAGGVALALRPDQVFQDARKRIDLVFKLNLGIAIVLALILLVGLGGAVLSAVLLGRDVWAMAFGGVAIADLIGLYVFKPLTAINAAIVASQRLDVIHLRVREQLTLCNNYPDLERRIKCQTKVWNTMQKDLAALSA